MAAGIAVPVVPSRIGGISEVIGEDESAGLLGPPGDIESLVAAVHRVLDDSDPALALGNAARTQIENDYAPETMVERTLDVYRIAGRRLGRDF